MFNNKSMVGFQNTLGKSLKRLLAGRLVDEEKLIVVRRPPFYNEYKLALTVSMDFSAISIFDFEQIKNEILDKLNNNFSDFGIVRTYTDLLCVYVYTNDPNVIDSIASIKFISFDCIKIVSRDCWNKILPKQKEKQKYYNKYSYRIKFKGLFDLRVLTDHKNYFKGNFLIPNTYSKFVYLESPNDVVLLRMMFSNDIIEVNER